METIGERLRNMRTARELTLEQVSARLKIAVRYLEALEEDRFQMLPDETYITSFLRSYASFLGMPPDETIRLYRRETPDTGAEEEKLWTDEPEHGAEASRQVPLWAYVTGGAAVVAAALLYYFLRA